MNGKQAKRLRKAALGLAATLEESGRQMSERNQDVSKGSVENTVDSVRFIYRRFKKGVSLGVLAK